MKHKIHKDGEYVWATATTSYMAVDTYEAEIPIKNRLEWFLSIPRALIKGTVKLEWKVPQDAKRKGVYIKGKKVQK